MRALKPSKSGTHILQAHVYPYSKLCELDGSEKNHSLIPYEVSISESKQQQLYKKLEVTKWKLGTVWDSLKKDSPNRLDGLSEPEKGAALA